MLEASALITPRRLRRGTGPTYPDTATLPRPCGTWGSHASLCKITPHPHSRGQLRLEGWNHPPSKHKLDWLESCLPAPVQPTWPWLQLEPTALRAGRGGSRAWVAGRPRSWPGKWRRQGFAPLSRPEGSAPPLLGARGCSRLDGRVPEQSLSPPSRTFGEAESGRRKHLLAPVKATRGLTGPVGQWAVPGRPPAQVVSVGGSAPRALS